MIIKNGASPASKLEVGKSLDANNKNPMRYNNGNFTKSAAVNFALLFLPAAILKRLTVNKKLAIDHRFPNKNPAPQKNLPTAIETIMTATMKPAVSFKDVRNDWSNATTGYNELFLSIIETSLITLHISNTAAIKPKPEKIKDI